MEDFWESVEVDAEVIQHTSITKKNIWSLFIHSSFFLKFEDFVDEPNQIIFRFRDPELGAVIIDQVL